MEHPVFSVCLEFPRKSDFKNLGSSLYIIFFGFYVLITFLFRPYKHEQSNTFFVIYLKCVNIADSSEEKRSNIIVISVFANFLVISSYYGAFICIAMNPNSYNDWVWWQSSNITSSMYVISYQVHGKVSVSFRRWPKTVDKNTQYPGADSAGELFSQ